MEAESEYFRVQPTAEEQAAFALYGNRQRGATASEAFLLALCERSFLSLWSYAGIYRKANDGTTKEVCDVLVVFDEHIIIFSDKHCAFGEAPDIKVAWRRWFNRAIQKSANQLFGALAILTSDAPVLFVDNACKVPFPYKLPAKGRARVHLIAVARGAASACKEYYGSGSGSLVSNSSIAGEAHYASPFNIGIYDRDKHFIHIFDEVALEAVFSTFTTTADFVKYLEDRQHLLTTKLLISSGEEETVACYFAGADSAWDGSFNEIRNKSKGSAIQILEGHWKAFQAAIPDKFALMQVSSLWDGIIESTARSMQRGEMSIAYPPDIETQESVLRLLALEPRHRRIYLSAQIQGLFEGTPNTQRSMRTLVPESPLEKCYVFLCYPFRGDDYKAYQEERRVYLLSYAYALKTKYEHVESVIGMTFDNWSSGTFSVEVVIVDLANFSKEDRDASVLLRNEHDFFVDTKEWYPSLSDFEGIADRKFGGLGPKNLKPED